jgi:hypothetical protein
MIPTVLFTFFSATNLVLSLVQESEISADFNDLGKLMLGGFAAAIAVALTFTLVKMRLRDRKPRAADVLSINATEKR